MLSPLIKDKIDIFLVCETKINDSFPTAQFLIPGFSPPFRLDRTSMGGGILLYARADIPSKLLDCHYCKDIECLSIELCIAKKKWLVYGIYNPSKTQIKNICQVLLRV